MNKVARQSSNVLLRIQEIKVYFVLVARQIFFEEDLLDKDSNLVAAQFLHLLFDLMKVLFFQPCLLITAGLKRQHKIKQCINSRGFHIFTHEVPVHYLQIIIEKYITFLMICVVSSDGSVICR